MSFTVTISVTGVLKSFFGTLLLSTGGAVVGFLGGLAALAMMGGVGGGGSRVRMYGMEIPMFGIPAGFALGTAASVYFFGWTSLLCVPAVLLVIAGLYLYLTTRK